MPKDNLNNGKPIVLILGDEEYRSEELYPMLAKILTEHHGFKTIVLLAINSETDFVDPAFTINIPGWNPFLRPIISEKAFKSLRGSIPEAVLFLSV